MSISTNDKNQSYFTTMWQYIGPPMAAATAIVPSFYFFLWKSALQMGESAAHITLKQGFKGGLKAAPVIGGIVGGQIILSDKLEAALKGLFPKAMKNEITKMLSSAFLVGLISTPALAIFNAITMGTSPMEAVKKITLRQAGATATREALFVASLKVSAPVSEMMKNKFGDNWFVTYGTTFFTGATASALGQPLDTFIIRNQKGLKITNISEMYRGTIPKSIGVGAFATFYKLFKELVS